MEPASANQIVHGDQEEIAPPKILPKSDAKATAKTAKVTLVLDPLSITVVSSEGKKQTKLIVAVGAMKFAAMVNSKSYRKAFVTLAELGADNCAVILQAVMTVMGNLNGNILLSPLKWFFLPLKTLTRQAMPFKKMC